MTNVEKTAATGTSTARDGAAPVLEVENLHVEFKTREGVVRSRQRRELQRLRG